MRTAAVVAMLVAAGAAGAEMVEVRYTGEVEYNQVNFGTFMDVAVGDPVTITFMVDSDNYVDSPNYPTRGYEIDHASFSMTLGSVVVGLQDPFPMGETPYFVLRNNDPAVDGFFVSTNLDFPFGVPLSEPGQFDQFTANAQITYNNDPLPSLDILDAIGTYDYDGLTSFYFTVNDGPFEPIGVLFTDMTIVPAPGAIAALSVLIATRRRRD